MKKFNNHQRPRRKYRFDIVGHKKAVKIWRDSPFNVAGTDDIGPDAGVVFLCRFMSHLQGVSGT